MTASLMMMMMMICYISQLSLSITYLAPAVPDGSSYGIMGEDGHEKNRLIAG